MKTKDYTLQRMTKEQRQKVADDLSKKIYGELAKELVRLDPEAELKKDKNKGYRTDAFTVKAKGAEVSVTITQRSQGSGYYVNGVSGEVDVMVGDYGDSYKKRFPHRKDGLDIPAIASYAINAVGTQKRKEDSAAAAAAAQKAAWQTAHRLNKAAGVPYRKAYEGCPPAPSADCPHVHAQAGELRIYLPSRSITESEAAQVLAPIIAAFGKGSLKASGADEDYDV